MPTSADIPVPLFLCKDVKWGVVQKSWNAKRQLNCEERKRGSLSNNTDCVVYIAINLGLIWGAGGIYQKFPGIGKLGSKRVYCANCVVFVCLFVCANPGKMDCCDARRTSACVPSVSTRLKRQIDTEEWRHQVVAWETRLMLRQCHVRRRTVFLFATANRVNMLLYQLIMSLCNQ